MKKLLISTLAVTLMTSPSLAFYCPYPLTSAMADGAQAGMVLDRSYEGNALYPPEVGQLLDSRESFVPLFDQIFVLSSDSLHRRLVIFALEGCTVAVYGQDYTAS